MISNSIVTTFLLSGIVVCILKFLFDYLYLKYQFRKVPTVAGLPFIGIVWDLLRIPNEDYIEWYTDIAKPFNGNVYITWLGTRPFINIQKPEHMKILLGSTVNINKSDIYDLIKPWLGDGLLTASGEKWFHGRRLLSPSVHFDLLEQFAVIMFEKAEILNSCLSECIVAHPDELIEIFSYISKFGVDIICKTAMGVDIDVQRSTINEAYSKALREYTALTEDRYVRPWYRSDYIYSKTQDGKRLKNAIKILHDFTLKVIRDKIDERRELNSRTSDNKEDEFGKKKSKIFLDLLIEASENDEYPLTLDEIREQVDTFMFAGHDTTATAIYWSLFLLGNELHVQENARKEIQTILDNDVNKSVKIADLNKLKYLDRVIKETLRIYPSVPFIFRDLSENVVFDGYEFPKGSTVTVNIFDLHRSPEIWENPNEFNPDRFLPENQRGRHPYAYIPFSAGPRNCVGQKFAMLEMKIALITILRNFYVKSEKTPAQIKLENAVILRASQPLQFKLIPIID